MDRDLEFLTEEIRSDRKAKKRPRHKKRKRRSLLPLFLLLLLLAAAAGGAAFWWQHRPAALLAGKWHKALDLTPEAYDHALLWLMRAEESEKIDLSAYLDSLEADVWLTLAEDGSYSVSLDRASYDMAEENAYLGLEYALEDLLLLRMQAEGQDVASREEAAQCIGETLGISCSEYLKEYGPELLPPYEELQGAIEENGRWHEEKGVLFRNEKGAAYVAGKDLLVLSGVEGTEVYYRYED